jgi:hypothetical protein
MINVVKPEDLFKVPEVAIRRWPGIIVHHSGGKAGPKWRYFFKGVIGKLYGERFDRFHRKVKGYRNGLGYHFLINPGGEIEYGKRWLWQISGAHCTGHNNWLGVCFVGNFNWWKPTGLQLQAWRNIVAWFKPGIPIRPHGRFKKTMCPGTKITVNYWFRNIDP